MPVSYCECGPCCYPCRALAQAVAYPWNVGGDGVGGYWCCRLFVDAEVATRCCEQFHDKCVSQHLQQAFRSYIHAVHISDTQTLMPLNVQAPGQFEGKRCPRICRCALGSYARRYCELDV
jgi:hypothetical protein